LVKRVLGLPGEEVRIDFGEVLINEVAGLDRWGVGSTFPEGGWSVGQDEVFVLSDRRTATVDDSRTFGPVAVKRVLRLSRLRGSSLSSRGLAD
jgi:type IV secretory pathway protease TraF